MVPWAAVVGAGWGRGDGCAPAAGLAALQLQLPQLRLCTQLPLARFNGGREHLYGNEPSSPLGNPSPLFRHFLSDVPDTVHGRPHEGGRGWLFPCRKRLPRLRTTLCLRVSRIATITLSGRPRKPPGWRDRVLDQASTWLRDRIGLDIDLSADADLRSKDRSKRAQVLYRNSGRDHGVRLRVWNSNRDGTFVVTVLAVEQPRGGLLHLSATCDDPRRVSKKPRVTDQFLEVVDFEDVTPLRPEPKYISISSLNIVEELIASGDRRLPVIVAAPVDNDSFDSWNTYVTAWTRQTVGIAHVFSLDPLATEEFRSRHPAHAVRQGTLRTYPSGMDLSDSLTAKAARWLGV